MVNKFRTVTILSAAMITAIFGSAGYIHTASAKEAAATLTSQPQAMPVEVAIVEDHAIRLWKQFSGRLSAVDYVEIRPQASGLITEVKFNDGQHVAKDDILYVIDPRPLKSIVEQKKANLFSAKDSYDFAIKEYKRTADLVAKKMVAQQVLDDRINNKLVADSNVKLAQAELSEAEINLSYAYIKAPISGTISRTELTVGNLVSSGSNAPLLTSIVANDRVYADFEVDEQTYLRFRKNTSPDLSTKFQNPVELTIEDGNDVYLGKIHSFDNKIDPNTGTIRARAIFDNPESKLLSGMYAHLKLGSATEEKTILISERAIGTDQNRKFVYVVNEDNKTAYREVVIGDSIEGSRIVHSGLKSGDKVIVRGLMRVQPDMLVEPKVLTTTELKTDKS
jgi:multidrug efflux system membrane fusion protein